MAQINLLKDLIKFYKSAEKLKVTLRHSYLSNPARQESSAEHSWMSALLAIVLCRQVKRRFNELRLIKMLIIHDLAEAITGDHPAFNQPKDKYKKEVLVLKKITKPLPPKLQKEFLSLFQEFEKQKTYEAKLAQAIDKIEVVMQHNIADISTWDEGDFSVHLYYRDELFYFDPFIRKFKDLVDQISAKKVKSSGRKVT